MAGASGVILKIVSESCFWTKIFQYNSIQIYMTLWGCNIKQWAVLFKINKSTYQFRTSLFKIVANFDNNTDIHINEVAQNLYVVNLKASQSPLKQTNKNIELTDVSDKVNDLDTLFLCPIVSSKDIYLQPIYKKDYFIFDNEEFYKENLHMPNSGLIVIEILKHQHAIINIKKYKCANEKYNNTNRIKCVIYNLFKKEFTVEIIKSHHNYIHCFYCNIIKKIPEYRHKTLIFNPQYTQAILNF